MGGFYSSISVKGPERREIVDYLNTAKRKAYVAPTQNACTVLYWELVWEEAEDVFDDAPPKNPKDYLALRLSERFLCPVLSVLTHDGDVMSYDLYLNGQLVDQYNSSPGYFDNDAFSDKPWGGNADILCRAFGVLENTEEVETILRMPRYYDDLDAYKTLILDRLRELQNPGELMQPIETPHVYLAEEERHAELCAALGIPCYAGYTSIDDIQRGNPPRNLSLEDLILTGG